MAPLFKIKRKPVQEHQRRHPLSGHRASRASILSRSIPILLSLPPLILSVILLEYRNHVATGWWRQHISENPSAASAARQMISGIMGTLQASAVLAILCNFPARTRLAQSSKAIKLDTLGLMSALSVPRMDWNLPKTYWPLIVILAVGLGHGPAALWASAITPIPTTITQNRGSISVPRFSEASRHYWAQQFNHGFRLEHCHTKKQPLSSEYMSNCPLPYYQNALLNTARGATTPDGTPRIHPKLDNPKWAYHGRSYGVGSSVGLGSVIGIGDSQPRDYSFAEEGYNASVHCNFSSQDNLKLEYKVNQGSLGIFRLKGSLPDVAETASDPITAWCSHSPDKAKCEDPTEAAIFAWLAGSGNQGNHMVAVAASGWYTEDFDNVECSIEFNPTRFIVNSNVTDSSITVVNSNSSTTTELEPTGRLVTNIVRSLHFLSKMSPSLYVSVMGDAFQYNVNITRNSSSYGIMTPREAGLRATEASFEAILDDILGIYGSGQIVIAKDVITARINGTFDGYHFGKPVVLYLTLLVNLVILSAIAVEVVRTRFWRDLPQYDIMDFKSTVAAASFGGRAISEKVRQQSREGNLWTADAGDRKLGSIAVRLDQDGSQEPRIVLGEDDTEMRRVGDDFKEPRIEDKGPLMQVEADLDGTERGADDETLYPETDHYASVPTAWSPIRLHSEDSPGARYM